MIMPVSISVAPVCRYDLIPSMSLSANWNHTLHTRQTSPRPRLRIRQQNSLNPLQLPRLLRKRPLRPFPTPNDVPLRIEGNMERQICVWSRDRDAPDGPVGRGGQLALGLALLHLVGLEVRLAGLFRWCAGASVDFGQLYRSRLIV